MLQYFQGTPRDQQSHILKELESSWDNFDVFVVEAPVAVGKCFGKDTEILMFSGETRKIQDVKIDDLVMGPDSLPRKVIELHRGIDILKRIVPNRKPAYVVTQDHILNILHLKRSQQNNQRRTDKEYLNISVVEYESSSADFKHNSWQHQATIEFNEKILPIDPYILGIWLGDGTSNSPELTTMNEEIGDMWFKEADKRNLSITIRSNGSKAYGLYMAGSGQKGGNSFKDDLISLNLINNKHIPLVYKTSSRQQRLALLSGLLDTDGFLHNCKSSFSVTQKSEQLLDDIIYIARSLGFSANKHTKSINGIKYYISHISGIKLSEITTKLCYKQPIDSTQDQTNCKFVVEDAGIGEYYGIAIDGDELFCLADFTVVHNSRCIHALAKWAGQAAILTPTNILLDQYERDFKDIAYLRRKELYPCCKLIGKHNCKQKLPECKDCLYQRARQEAKTASILAMNYYMYLSLRKHQNYRCRTLIVDEAQNLIPMLTDLSSVNIWKHLHKYPNNLYSEGDILEWLQKSGLDNKKEWKDVMVSLLSEEPSYRFERTYAYYRGTEHEVIKAKPISVKHYKPILWPGFVRKIVLMSATISHKDIEELGLDRKRVKYISTDSPIPPSSRPVIYTPVGSMAYKNQEETIPLLAEFINNVLAEFHSKGVIHCTYQTAYRLRSLLDNPRLIWHARDNKRDKYREFVESTNGEVLVASGLYEGCDFANDIGRWQIVTKVPYLSLKDMAVSMKMKQDPEWYQWEAIKTILQASGRVCRHPADYGITFIVDKNFGMLYRKNEQFFPRWFREALEWRNK